MQVEKDTRFVTASELGILFMAFSYSWVEDGATHTELFQIYRRPSSGTNCPYEDFHVVDFLGRKVTYLQLEQSTNSDGVERFRSATVINLVSFQKDILRHKKPDTKLCLVPGFR